MMIWGDDRCQWDCAYKPIITWSMCHPWLLAVSCQLWGWKKVLFMAVWCPSAAWECPAWCFPSPFFKSDFKAMSWFPSTLQSDRLKGLGFLALLWTPGFKPLWWISVHYNYFPFWYSNYPTSCPWEPLQISPWGLNSFLTCHKESQSVFPEFPWGEVPNRCWQCGARYTRAQVQYLILPISVTRPSLLMPQFMHL